MKKITTKKLVTTALFMAFTMIATMFIRIPLPLGYVNLGDAFIFLAVFILGPVCGVIAGGIVGTIVMAVGYFAYEILLFTTAGVALLNMPWNLLQGGVGITIAVAVMRVLTATKTLDKLSFYKK